MNHQKNELATILIVVTSAMLAWGYLLHELSTHLLPPTLT